MQNEKKLSQTMLKSLCYAVDELRDCWLSQQSQEHLSEILSLSASQFRMVTAVRRMTEAHPEGIMLKELAAKLSLSSSAVSVMVDGMVRRGFFARVTSTEDRRKVNIGISESGKERIRANEEFLQSICADFIRTQPEEKVIAALEFLQNFATYLNENHKE
ncbi:MAG: winged helix-turn-helix transcriptional regulator [Lentisphaeria bacterium]|nr:winged helix-turn-helix transcriptional regulator [Lentisphaeria bacterium]